MPCPDFNVRLVSRKAGESAVAAAAYQSCSKIYSEYDEQWKSYTYKWLELVHQEIMLPANAPPEYADRKILWNAVEATEKSWNAQLARRLRMALPREVPSDQYVTMVREYCQEHFVSKGMICDFAIHNKGDGNPHVHILLTLRSLDEQGHWCPKCRKEYILDEEGNKIRLPSGEWKSRRVDVNDWNNKSNCEVWRHGWEVIQNRYLEMNDRPERVDLRSYARQGIDQISTVHMGPAVAALERKGIQTNIGNLNRDIRETNSLMQTIRNIIRGLKKWISDISVAKQAILDAIAEMKEPTLPEILVQYMELRQEERSTWSSKSQLKGTLSDYEKISKTVDFLKENKIDTVQDLSIHLERLEKTTAEAKGIIKYNEKRYQTINSIKKAVGILEKYKPIHDAYMKKGFKIAKDHYAEAHKEELDAYNRAYRFLMKVEGSVEIDIAKLDSEIVDRRKQDHIEQAKLDSVQGDLEQLRIVRYYVSRVMPEKIEPRTMKEQLEISKIKADRENAKRTEGFSKQKKQNIEI
ncbi:MAG: MobA/MobL family protein [Dorea sp.]|nr:MobA/MobL family protein [Dorea sp.]